MDETAIAFEPPHARASRHPRRPAARPHLGARLYPRRSRSAPSAPSAASPSASASTSCSRSSHHTAAQDDDVDKVISYDTITEAIEHELAAERVNLLETLAERVAARCLADPRAVRVFVRIEKLDRIPGALGVEIVRSRLPGQRAAPPAGRSRAGADGAAGPPASSTSLRRWPPAPGPRRWRDALAAWGHPFVLCLGPRRAAARRPHRGTAPHRPARDRAGRLGLLRRRPALRGRRDRAPSSTGR